MANYVVIDLSWNWVWVTLWLLLLLPVLPLLVWRGHRLTYLACMCGLLMVVVSVLWIRNWSAEETLGLRLATAEGNLLITRDLWVVSRTDGTVVGFSRFEDQLQPHETRLSGPTLEWRRKGLPSGSSPYLPVPYGPQFRKWGFQWVNIDGVSGLGWLTLWYRAVRLPTWFMIPLLSAPIVVQVRVMLRQKKVRRWAREGRCGTCGYDLRAHKLGDKCPECGTPVPAPVADKLPSSSAPSGTLPSV